VASAISGIPELVEHRVCGLLVPPGDARALADALRTLDADRDLRERLGRAARLRVLAEFDLDVSAAELARRFGVRAAA
jgi:glycosyltransferase involved in cell wall biosynthesis